jgi:hypothetical protein
MTESVNPIAVSARNAMASGTAIAERRRNSPLTEAVPDPAPATNVGMLGA